MPSKQVEYNSCIYQPGGWGCACRFVAMRIAKEQKRASTQPLQCMLFEDDNYTTGRSLGTFYISKSMVRTEDVCLQVGNPLFSILGDAQVA